MQSQRTQVLNVKIVSLSSKRRKKDCSKLKQRGVTLDSRELKIVSFSLAGCLQEASGVFRAVGAFCAVSEEAAFEPCDAACICSVGRRRRKEAELSFSCLPGHWWHWVDRRGKGVGGGQGSSCLLSVVFEWCYLIDRELTTWLKDRLPGDSSRNCNSRVGHLAKR